MATKQVPWKHQPPEIRAALRRHRLRPVQNSCHLNCARLLLRAEELRSRLEYREGWVLRDGAHAFEHAWLLLDTVTVVDLTLNSAGLHYGQSYAVPFDEVLARFTRRGFGFVRPEALSDLGPYRRAIDSGAQGELQLHMLPDGVGFEFVVEGMSA